jgi:hypothetical protein
VDLLGGAVPLQCDIALARAVGHVSGSFEDRGPSQLVGRELGRAVEQRQRLGGDAAPIMILALSRPDPKLERLAGAAEQIGQLAQRPAHDVPGAVDPEHALVCIGDAVMAVWGAPLAREDDAERSVRAGMEIVDEVVALGAAPADPGAPSMTQPIGATSDTFMKVCGQAADANPARMGLGRALRGARAGRVRVRAARAVRRRQAPRSAARTGGASLGRVAHRRADRGG